MVFERWLSPLLASVLGHYVEGIQIEQLQVGLWNGLIRLDNVKLRLEARHCIIKFHISSELLLTALKPFLKIL